MKMIIPDYNKNVVNVHMKLNEKDFSLSKENIAAKAFMYLPYNPKHSIN